MLKGEKKMAGWILHSANNTSESTTENSYFFPAMLITERNRCIQTHANNILQIAGNKLHLHR